MRMSGWIGDRRLSTDPDRTPDHHRGQTIFQPQISHGMQSPQAPRIRQAPSCSSLLGTVCANSGSWTALALSGIARRGGYETSTDGGSRGQHGAVAGGAGDGLQSSMPT